MRYLGLFVFLSGLAAFAAGCKSDDLVRPKGGKGNAGNDPAAQMPNPVAQNNPAPQQQPPQGQPNKEREFGPAPVVKKPKTLLGNIRARGDQAARNNELKNIRLFYEQYCLDHRNPNSRTLDSFLKFIQRDSAVIHDAIKNKEYTMNLKAQGGEDIVAYETEPYTQGYSCVRMDGFIGFVSEAEWKKGTGNP